MSTTTSSIRNIKSRLPTSNSINNMTTNGNETKTNQVYMKKPLSATNILQNCSSTNGYHNHLRKRAVLSNNFRQNKSSTKSIPNGEKNNTNNGHHNGHYTIQQSLNKTDQPPSPPTVLHAIAPSSLSQEINNPTKETFDEQKSNNDSISEPTRRIAHVFAHSNIKTMSNAISSCSDEEGESSLHRSYNQSSSSSLETDADESDHELNNNNIKQISKPRRLQKTRKLSLTSNNNIYTPPLSKTHIRKDDQQQQQQQQSSSNDDDNNNNNNNKINNNEINGINEELILNNRRFKGYALKKHEHLTTTTTTDDDTTKYYHRYHPLDNLEMNRRNFLPNSSCSSPIPTIATPINQIPVRKANRFQVKSIRKSQQPQILLANVSTAKSSNDDDCSVPNQKIKITFKPSLYERKHTNTPTTDGENLTTNTDSIVNGAATALTNGGGGGGGGGGHHRVRFHVTQHKKHESTAEEEKVPVPTVTLPTPAPPSSAASAQGEDEEEAVAKSPDHRFIKYAKEIGRGAFKTVYRGLDTETSVAVAWCELQDFAQFDKHERARFKEEAEMLKKLQHQNIVRFYDFWEETNPRTNKKVIILVTELMTSGSLKGYIRNFKGQKEEKRINVMKKWCRQILKGLAYLHSRNPPVIHRDLKCDNVFISSTTGCVKIGDLGLATFKTQTFAKSMRGTMEFMAPEMFDEKYDELVDIYSFGLCMLEMITGEYPYIECKGPTAVIKRVTAGLKPDCYYKVESEDVREVIDCCIRTKKEERLSVHDLLLHSFFHDDNCLRIDLVRDSSGDSPVMIKNDSIDLKLKIVDKTKRKALYAEHKVSSSVFEAILFPYNFKTDTPERIADELIGKNYIFDDDKKFVIQSIKDRLRAYQYEQLDRQAGVFCRDGKKPVINQTPQPSMIIQQQQQQQQLQQQQQQQQQTTPVVHLPQATPVAPVTAPVPSLMQQISVDQQQQQMVKPSSEIPPVKQVAATEPTPITPLPDLNPNIPGSADSLQVLEAALMKTFNIKINAPQGTSTTSTMVNENNEPLVLLTNQEDSLLSKPTTIEQQQSQPTDEPGLSITSELSPNISQPTTATILQLQSQPTTMLTNQFLQNSHLLTQPSQSVSYSAIPLSQHTIPNDANKQIIPPPPPPSSSPSPVSTAIEAIENSHIPISPSPTPLSISHTNETVQSSTTSDTQPQVFDSLQQLDALLMNTFKKPGKTAGTAHSSDGEAATTTTSIPLTNFDDKNETEILLNESTNFDPLISSDNGTLQELETLLKSTSQKSLSNDDTITITSTTNDEIFDLKSLIMDLSRSLLNKMNVIETKIDDHCNQTRKMNQLLTNTVLPSILDLTDIIQETLPTNLDLRVKTKLENIQTRIRTTQQQQQTEMKDLMDI